MKLIDTHCHLESDELINDLDKIISDAKNAGVVKFISSSVIPSQWELSKSIAKKYSEIEFTLGIHPWFASLDQINMLDKLYSIKETGAVAIGEIGLDTKIENPVMDVQIKIFEAQLEIAKEINIPIVVHCRGAFNQLLDSVKRVGISECGGMIHAFSGSAELAHELIKHKFSFSMGGSLTYKKSNKRIKLLQKIYPDYFLLETDSPDIPPVQHKDGPNIPANIIFNLNGAAELTGDSKENVAFNATKNSIRIFNLNI